MLVAIFKAILITVEVISSVLLIGIILIQKSKSQGMGMAFGGGVGESIFGAQMGNVLTKATVILAIVFFANTTLLAMVYSTGREAALVEQPGRGAPVEVTPIDPTELQDQTQEAPDAEIGVDETDMSVSETIAIPDEVEAPEEDVDAETSEETGRTQ